MRVGIIGYNEGNGHPFSFSAIVNGYNPDGFVQAGWQVILNYLQAQPQSSFDFSDVEVTHAWTQNPKITQELCTASCIPHAVTDIEEMIGQVDAVIIARDDYESHFSLARSFLEYGTPVFIDKPLAFAKEELEFFSPYLKNALLMSTSGMRYAKELDELRENPKLFDELILIDGVILFNLEKYGIHLLDAINGLHIGRPSRIMRLSSHFESYRLELDSGISVNLSCLGNVSKVLHLSFYGKTGHQHYELADNFSAFKRTLKQFFHMVKTKQPVIHPAEVVNTMCLINQARSLHPAEMISLKQEASHYVCTAE